MPQQGEFPQTFVQTAKERIDAIKAVDGANAMKIDQQYGPGQSARQPSGEQVGLWMERNMPIINAMTGNTSASRGRVPRPQPYVPRPGTIPTPSDVARQYRGGGQGTAGYINDWFQSAGRNLIPGSAAADEWRGANMAWMQGEENAPAEFYRRHASEMNMVPNPNRGSNGSSLWQTFRRGMGGSRSAGGGWSAEGMAGAAGGLVSRMLPIAGPLALGAAAVGFASSSFNQYMDSGNALSDLTKQILSTKDSLETLQGSVTKTGAAMGYLPQETAKISLMLGAAYGSMSMGQLNRNVAQTVGMARSFGVSADVLSQGFASAAQMGITSGPGSNMSQGQLALALAGSAAQSGMSGRMTDLIQELLTAVQGTVGTGVVANTPALLGIMTTMNANLPRSLQGSTGGTLLNQIGQGIASPGLGGAGQMITLQSMMSNGISGYLNAQQAMQMGPAYVLPSGKTSMQAVIDQLTKTYGAPELGSAESGYMGLNTSSSYEEYLLSKMWGISGPQAGAMLNLFGSGGKGMASLQQTLGISASDLTNADWSKLGILSQVGAAKSQTDINQAVSDYERAGGQLTPAQKKALQSGNIGEEQKTLAQDILKGKGYSPLTTTEQINTLNADVKTLQITLAGNAVSSLKNALEQANSAQQQSPISPTTPGASGFWGIVEKALESMGKPWAGNGFYMSYNSGATSGGYQYSPAMVATAMGMGGLNNAFTWLNARNSSGTGIVQTSYRPGGPGAIGGSIPSFSGSAASFISGMTPYAQAASKATGLPAEFILGQWGLESGWGTSQAAKQNLNFAGIKPFGGLHPGQDSKYAGFSSINDFLRAYENTINNPRYAGARAAAANGASDAVIANLLHQEGYATDPNYGSAVGGAASTVRRQEVSLSQDSINKLAGVIANQNRFNGQSRHWSPA